MNNNSEWKRMFLNSKIIYETRISINYRNLELIILKHKWLTVVFAIPVERLRVFLVCFKIFIERSCIFPLLATLFQYLSKAFDKSSLVMKQVMNNFIFSIYYTIKFYLFFSITNKYSYWNEHVNTYQII